MAEFDPYAVLGVAIDAPDFVIQAAYRACIKKYHPDHYAGADARQRTADILEAYRLIGTAEARSEFDRSRHGFQRSEPRSERPASDDQNKDELRPTPAPSPSQIAATKGNRAFWLLGAGVLVGATIFWGLGQQPTPANVGTDHVAPPPTMQPIVSPEIALPTSAAPALPSLDEVIAFKNPADCEMSSATEKLFRNLIKFDPPAYVGRRGPSVSLAGFEKPLTPSFSRKVDQGPDLNVRDNEATLATVGFWHGLRVTKIRVRYMEESSFWEHQIRFLEPASKVRKVLNEIGFHLPSIGEFREFTGDGVVSAGIGVEEVPGGSALTCGSSVYY